MQGRSNMEEKEELEKKLKPTDKRVTIFNFILIGIIFIGLFIYMITVDGLENILTLLKDAQFEWVFAGIVCMVIFWIFEALCLHFPLKKLYPTQTFFNSFKIMMIGQLFNNITPFSSGGQPMQAYEMYQDGKKVSDSFSVLSMKFIVTQTSLVAFTLIVMLFQFQYFANLIENFLWLAIIGFIVNIIAIVFIFLVGINQKLALCILSPIYRLLGKLHIFKNVDEKLEQLQVSIDNFHYQFVTMKRQKLVILKMFIAATFQCIAYYSITYMVYRAFGNSGVSIFNIIPAQAFLLMLMTFIPTPGSGVGAEGGFLLIFNSIFKRGTIHMSILFWRFYTFYLPILIGSLFLIPHKRKQNNLPHEH